MDAVKTQEKCRDCSGKDSCSGVYEALGGSKGPGVVLDVILVFALPIVIFISSLLVCRVADAGVGLAVGMSVFVTAVYIFTASFVVRSRYNRCSSRISCDGKSC